MKTIVNGKRYDTEKAILVGEADSLGREADSVTDFRYWEATLYKTPRSGRFFLAGEGGPMTRFAQSAGQNSWTGGADIIPMDRYKALEWAEEYLSAEAIEKHFSDILEDA
jgi:hypothetical protein